MRIVIAGGGLAGQRLAARSIPELRALARSVGEDYGRNVRLIHDGAGAVPA